VISLDKIVPAVRSVFFIGKEADYPLVAFQCRFARLPAISSPALLLNAMILFFLFVQTVYAAGSLYNTGKDQAGYISSA
jgi:hypothetical protein